MRNKLFLFGLATFSISLIYIVWASLVNTDLNFVYPLDDSYIHLAIAQNLAEHGVWGVTQFEFTSSSSSPIYTVLLALLMKVFGNNSLLPFIFNIVIAYILIWFASKFIIEKISNINSIYQFIILNLFILFLPLNTIVFLGMEHTLHCLIVLLLSIEMYKHILNEKVSIFKIGLLVALAVGVRYESLFIVFTMSLLTLYKRDYKLFFIIVIASAIPIFAFGSYFISQGGRLIPYSVLVKSDLPKFTLEGINIFIHKVAKKAIINEGTTTLLLFSCFLLMNYVLNIKRGKTNISIQLLQSFGIVIFTTTLHSMFAGPDHFFRYEAYALVFTLWIIILCIKLEPSLMKNILIYFVILPGIIFRAYASFDRTALASANIYEQQYQMAQYIKSHTEIKNVAVNDIGAVAYFNKNIHILDLWGLATPKVSEFELFEKSSNLEISKLNLLRKTLYTKLSKDNNIDFAAVYPRQFKNILPDNWQVYDSLIMKSKRVVCADGLVYYYKVK